MGKPSQTFKKRQRENKLREKAQLKRERRAQRKNERKALQAASGPEGGAHPYLNAVEATAPDELGVEKA
jgi:hypothetical protein